MVSADVRWDAALQSLTDFWLPTLGWVAAAVVMGLIVFLWRRR